jgi:hypothetical protein
MLRPHLRRRAAAARCLLLAAAASACSSAPLAGAPPHFATQTITVTAAGLRPGGDLRIPAFGTVVWKNELAQGEVVVHIARPFEPSENCSTSLGFTGTGAESASKPIPPQGVAALCFHDAGSFPFLVQAPGGEWRGTIAVGGAP